MKFRILIFLIASVLVAQQKKEADFLVFSGQSNMTDIGKIKELSPKYMSLNHYKEVYVWNSNSSDFQPLTKAFPKKKFSLVIPFVYRYKELYPNKTLYILRVAYGGRALHYAMNFKGWDDPWDGEAYKPGRDNFFPGLTADDQNKGSRYIELIDKLDKVKTKLKSKKIDTTVDAFFWMQGEADTKNEISANLYFENVSHLKKRFLEDAQQKEVPFIFGKILPNDDFNKEKTPYRNIIHKEMDTFAASDKNVHMVLAPADKMRSDRVHYIGRGYEIIGTNFCETYISIKDPSFQILPSQSEKEVVVSKSENTLTKTGKKKKGKKGKKKKGKSKNK